MQLYFMGDGGAGGADGGGFSLQEREHMRATNAQITAKKAQRQQLMRDADRERAVVKGVAYGGLLEAAQLEQVWVADQEAKQRAQEELRRLSDVCEKRLGLVGQAHFEARALNAERQRQRAEQELRAAELAQREEYRFQEALAKVQAEQGAGRVAAQQLQQRRAQILAAERSKAAAFAAEQQERSQAHKRKQLEAERLEQERRKRAPHDLDFFKHSRVHEWPLAPAAAQPVFSAPPPPLPFDPRLAAEAYERKWVRCGSATSAWEACFPTVKAM